MEYGTDDGVKIFIMMFDQSREIQARGKYLRYWPVIMLMEVIFHEY